jgi:hypothetical protein
METQNYETHNHETQNHETQNHETQNIEIASLKPDVIYDNKITKLSYQKYHDTHQLSEGVAYG